MIRQILVSGCVLAVVLGASSAAAQSGARAAIESANKQFMAAVSKGDAAALAGMYSTDARVFPPNSDAVRGRAEIQKMWQAVIDSGLASLTLSTTEVESSADIAYEIGTYEMKMKDGKGAADRGKYIVVWKRDGGRWLLHRDMWNTSLPAR